MNSHNQTCVKSRLAKVFNYHCQHYIYNPIPLNNVHFKGILVIYCMCSLI